MGNSLTVVMYHYVRDRNVGPYKGLKVRDTKEFDNQIKFISSNYNVITAEDLVSFFKYNDKIPENSCMLTFDDGYIDHYKNVLPILNKYNFKGCFYPTVIGSQQKVVLEVNKIHVIMSEIGYSYPNDLINRIKLCCKKLVEKEILDKNFSFDDLFNQYFKASGIYSKEEAFIKATLQYALPQEVRTMIINTIFKDVVSDSEESIAHSFYMSEDQIKELVNNGMHVGVHSANHVWLNKVSKEDQEKEIILSLDFLSKIYGSKTLDWSIAYPFGGYNSDTLDLCSKYNCAFAFTTVPQLFSINKDKYLEISRLDTNVISF